MVDVPVNGQVLKWARKDRGLAQEDAARLLNWPLAELQEYEDEKRQPTLGKLETMASKYEVALVALLMPAPPTLPKPKLEDFRTHAGAAPEIALETQLAIETIWDYADSFAELRENSPEFFPILRVPEYSLKDNPEYIAKQERERIGVLAREQFSWKDDREAFLRWREFVEGMGIFVYVMKLGEEANCRGFSLWDERKVPVIVINAAERDYTARIYTLFHEYCHILIRMGGISDQNRMNSVEAFCNAFSAFFLMPRDVFVIEANRIKANGAKFSDFHVGRLSKRFRVSKSAVAIHLETLGLVATGFYRKLLYEWRVRNPSRSSGGRASHTEKLANKLGTKHISTIFAAYERGLLDKSTVFDLTGAKPKFFDGLRNEIAGRRAAYGRGARS